MARRRKDPKEIKLAQPDRSGPTDKTLLQWASERELFAQAEAREREQGKRPDGLRQEGKTGRERGGDEEGDEEDEEEEDGEEEEEEEEDDEEDGAVLTPGQERVLEAALWAFSLSTVHAMLDVLVQNQYAVEIELDRVAVRTGQAFLGTSPSSLSSRPVSPRPPPPFNTKHAPPLTPPVFLLLLYTLHPHKTTTLPLLPPAYQAPFLQLLFLATSALAGCYLVHMTNTSGHIAVMKRAPTIGCLWLWAVVELELVLSVVSVAVVGGFLFFGGYDLK